MTCICEGKGRITEICDISGAKLVKTCPECEGSGIKLRIRYANVMCHKNTGDTVWMHSTLFEYKQDAENYKHAEYIVVKTIEVKI